MTFGHSIVVHIVAEGSRARAPPAWSISSALREPIPLLPILSHPSNEHLFVGLMGGLAIGLRT
jgi:hypothetical protein